MKTKKIQVSDSDEISVQVFKPQLYINNLVILFRWYLMSVVWLVNYCRGSTFSSTSRSLRSSSGMICILCYCLRIEIAVSPPHPPSSSLSPAMNTSEKHIQKPTHPKNLWMFCFRSEGVTNVRLIKLFTRQIMRCEPIDIRMEGGGLVAVKVMGCTRPDWNLTHTYSNFWMLFFKYHFQVAIYWFKSSPLLNI